MKHSGERESHQPGLFCLKGMVKAMTQQARLYSLLFSYLFVFIIPSHKNTRSGSARALSASFKAVFKALNSSQHLVGAQWMFAD